MVKTGIKMSARHLLGVKHLQRAAGCVTRVGKRCFFVINPVGIQALEALPRHQNLAANLKLAWPAGVRSKLHGNAANGLDIHCNVVTFLAIATRNGSYQPAIFVSQRD